MNAYVFCAEYAHETQSGRVAFSKRVVDKFIKQYTHLKPEDFTDDMRTRLKMTVMLDYYNEGISKLNIVKGLPAEKIELPNFVITGRYGK